MKKIALDERTKYRFTGILVIVSLAVIFLPAMIKRSNQQMSERINLSVKLPPKPNLPQVTMVHQQKIFEKVKTMAAPVSMIATLPSKPMVSKVAIQPTLATPRLVTPSNTAHHALKKALSHQLAARLQSTHAILRKQTAKEYYAVQLAAFSQEKNAMALVARLKSKGYTARYFHQGALYKVMVHSQGNRDHARVLQKKLASSLQMTGLIVKAAVS